MATPPDWQHLEHGADIGVQGRGSTLEDAFEQAALAMSAVVTAPDTINTEEVVEVECEADDYELLLLDWLNEIIYQMATRRMLFGKFRIQIDDGKLRGKLYGEPVDRERHQPAVEIKGATMTGLAVDQNDSGDWVVQCVIDV